MKLTYYTALVTFFILLSATTASHQVDVIYPTSIITTVGKLTTVQLDIMNKESTIQSYRIVLKDATPLINDMEITNPDINTQPINPNQRISVYSSIRTLTEAPNVLTAEVYGAGEASPTKTVSMPVRSKKFSLPEFGLVGFLQIIAVATVLYFLFYNKLKANLL